MVVPAGRATMHGARGGHWVLALTGSMLLLAAASSSAVDVLPDQAPAPDSLEAQVQARAAALNTDSVLDPDTRVAALARLKDAQQLLQAAAADQAEAARLAAEREAAPGHLAGPAAGSAGGRVSAEPEDWSSRSLAQLEVLASEAENLARTARQAVADVRRQLADLRSHRPLFGAELAAAREAAANAADRVAKVSAAGQQFKGTGSEQLHARARQQFLETRLALLEEQRSGADLREQFLEVRAAAAEREAAMHEGRLRAIRAELARQRLSDAVAHSSGWQDSVIADFDAVAHIARSNGELAGLYAGAGSMTHRLDEAKREAADLERTLAQFRADSTELRARLDGLGRTYAAGLLVRQGIDELPSVAAHQERGNRRRVSINETQMRIVALASELRRLERDLPGEVASIVASLPGLAAADRDEAVAVVGRLLEARRRIVTPLLHDLDQLLNVQVELQARERSLLADVQAMNRHLRSRESWVRNGRRVTLADLPAAVAGLAALATTSVWAGSGAAAAAAVQRQPAKASWAIAAVLAAAGMLLALRRRRMRAPSPDAAAGPRIRPAAVLATALLNGLAAAAIAAAAAWWLGQVTSAPVALRILGDALLHVVPGIFAVGFLAPLFAAQGGVADVKPGLAPMTSRARSAVGFLVAVLALQVASRVLVTVGAAGQAPNGELGARLCLLLSAILCAIGIHRAMGWRLKGGAYTAGRRGARLAVGLYALAAMIPIAFLILLTQGFVVGAYELVRALIGTLLVLVIVGTVRVLFLRTPSVQEGEAVAWTSLRRGRIDLLHILVTIAAAALLLWIWREVFVAVGYLQDVRLWTTETADGLKTVTVANLLSCLTVLGGTLLAFSALPVLLGTDSLDATQRSVGTRYAVVSLVRYVVLFVGLAVAFSLLNIGWSKLQWLAAGLSVGLGFGLQETAANFFSGLTLLSERSIRVGDLVTVGDKTGVVTRIKVRATTVRDFDGRDIVIPNKELVTTQVTNWTLTDPKRRLQIAVGVAYGSDTALVVRQLLEAASHVEGVLADPPPQAVFEQFGDSVLQFRLYVWIGNPQDGVRVNHELHMRIDQMFRDAGISIDFPQSDVHLFPAGPLEVRLSPAPVRGVTGSDLQSAPDNQGV
jgi:potassium efflux system protein